MPKVVNLSQETVISQLRDAIRSYRENHWSSVIIDNEKFTLYRDRIQVCHIEQHVVVSLRGSTSKQVQLEQHVTIRNPITPEQFDALLLLRRALIIGPIELHEFNEEMLNHVKCDKLLTTQTTPYGYLIV